jgi:hypothetical protein
LLDGLPFFVVQKHADNFTAQFISTSGTKTVYSSIVAQTHLPPLSLVELSIAEMDKLVKDHRKANPEVPNLLRQPPYLLASGQRP